MDGFYNSDFYAESSVNAPTGNFDDVTITNDLPVSDGGTGASTEADARSNLGLAIGSDVQAYNADLTTLAGLSSADSNFIVGSATGWVVESGSTARTSLGLGSIATQDSDSVSITGGSITGITDLSVADGGTGRSSSTAYAVICGGTTTTGAQQSIASVGTSGQVLTSNGAGALPTFEDPAGSGKLLQLVASQSSSLSSGSTAMVFDDTIPQSTEGTEFITLSITPESSSNTLVIEADLLVQNDDADYIGMALYQDSTANALTAAIETVSTSDGFTGMMHLKHIMTAGTTSPTTFKIRAGGNIGTTYINSANLPDGTYTEVTTTMSDYTSGTVTISASGNNYPAWQAFDNNASNFWESSSVSSWIQYANTVPQTISRYTMQALPASLVAVPTAWTLEASNTGDYTGEEVVLDTQSSISWSLSEIKTFTFTNTTAYEYYRIVVTAVGGGASAAISEIELYEEDLSPARVFGTIDKSKITITEIEA